MARDKVEELQAKQNELEAARPDAPQGILVIDEPQPVRREKIGVVCAFCGTPSTIVITTNLVDGKEVDHCEFTICCDTVAERANVGGVSQN